MKYLLGLILAFIFTSQAVTAKKIPLSGKWLLTKVKTGDREQKIYFPLTFQDDGKLSINDREVGTWKYDKQTKTVAINSPALRKMSGDNKVLKINKQELILEKDGSTLFFRKLDPARIAEENKSSAIMGIWKFTSKDRPELTRYLTFSAPDRFSLVETEPGVTSRAKGLWIVDKKANTLTLTGRLENLKGENKIRSVDNGRLILENDGKTFEGERLNPATGIEHLTFQEGDFYDTDGNFKYDDDEGKLPWQDPIAVIDFLKNVHQLSYQYSTLVQDVNVFHNKTLVAHVKADPEKEKVCVDFIFSGYDTNHLPEDPELPPNCMGENTYNRLFPEKEATFRVVGKEQITTPAGTFHCTVIEAVTDSEARQKLWMIDDKPGVYAKIIEEKPDEHFGYYHLFELQNIK